jgi:hypothetical protein
MEIEIIDEPIRFRLHGKWSVVENQRYGEVGLRLMNELWKAVKDAKMQTTGINHWVYMAGERMFVGVEVKNAQQATIPGGSRRPAKNPRRNLRSGGVCRSPGPCAVASHTPGLKDL